MLVTDIENKPQNNGTSLVDPAIKKDEKPVDMPADFYTEAQKGYITYLQNRLQTAESMKRQPLPEFNNKTYYQDYDENVKIANTKLPPKENEDDVVLSSGTIEAKLEALLSHINGLDLSPEVLAYDKENNLLSELGLCLGDTVFMTEQIDGGVIGGDEEKKLLRQRELLAQNAVFVQEEWLRKFEIKKKLKARYNGEFAAETWEGWSQSLELVFEGPSRTLLYGPNVTLGNISEYFMDDQPYIFVGFIQDYDVAKTKYGKFENWKYVRPGAIPEGTTNEAKSIYDNKWRLQDVGANQVEIILYQDKPNDEFQILINGVLMLPIGFPLSAVSPMGHYNIMKQILKPKHAKFAYGTAFVASGSVKQIAAIIDEMLKLFVLKTRKSYATPYINTSGRVISRRVLSAGRITMGIPPDALVPIGNEGQGVTASEFNVLKELQDRVDKSTISNQFAGQQGKSGTTATEVLELQRQAKLTLGLTITAVVMMEKKLGYLRLWNILANWFNPFDTKVVTINDVKQYLNRYRKTVRETNIEDEGIGERQIIPVDNQDAIPEPAVIRGLENQESKDRQKPIQKIYLSTEDLKIANLRWYIVINPKEKEGSAFLKVLFREELADIQTMMGLGSMPNKDGLEEEFARVWGKSRNKIFSSQAVISPDMGGVSPSTQGRSTQSGAPNLGALAAAGQSGTSG